MFTVYHSNDLEVLVSLGCVLMRGGDGTERANPFEPARVIVQNKGMESYVRQRIAAERGICAGIAFQLPWEFLRDLDDTIERGEGRRENAPGPGETRRETALDRAGISWILLRAFLEEPAFRPENAAASGFGYVSRYIWKRDESGEYAADPVKSLQLADRLGEIYENYLIYRQDWIKSWNEAAGDDGAAAWIRELNRTRGAGLREEDYLWIARLWRDFVRGGVRGDYAGADNLSFTERLRGRLDRDPAALRAELASRGVRLPRSVYVYGLSSIAPAALDLLVKLGRHADVHFMFTNPCAAYWGDLRRISPEESAEEALRRLGARRARSLDGEAVKNAAQDRGEAPADLAAFAAPDEVPAGELRPEWYDDAGDPAEANALLLTCGRSGRDTLSRLAELNGEDFVNEVCAFVRNDGGTLLGMLKNDILDQTFTPLDGRASAPGGTRRDARTINSNRYSSHSLQDHSLEIHSCATPMREVQVLYDHILERFRRDATLRPRDIAVFMPDVSDYAPYIDAVFGANAGLLKKHGENGGRIDLPYTICDRPAAEEFPEAEVFVRLMGVASEVIDNEAIFALLTAESVRRRFGFAPSDIPRVRKWLNENNIVKGLDREDTAAYGAGKDGYRNSFEAGLGRMLTGALMPVVPGFSERDYNTDPEGAEALELLGRLRAFYEALTELRRAFREDAPAPGGDENGETAAAAADAWHDFVARRVLEAFFSFEGDGLNLNHVVARHFESMKAEFAKLRRPPRLNLGIVREYLASRIRGQAGFSVFLRDKINFCGFVPMRAIPFRHIFLLGMNDGRFPRDDDGDHFDLMKRFYRKGDRSRRSEDCYMFLEAIVSARESLYISYVGRDVSKNSDRNPAMPVNELINYLASSCRISDDFYEELKKQADLPTNDAKHAAEVVRRALVIRESLNAYDARNFDGSNLNSYQSQWIRGAARRETAEKEGLWRSLLPPKYAGLDYKEDGGGGFVLDVALKDFERFFARGEKFFVRDVLKIRTGILEEEDLLAHERWPEYPRSDFVKAAPDMIRGADPGRFGDPDFARELAARFVGAGQARGAIAAGSVGRYCGESILAEKDGEKFAALLKVTDLLERRERLLPPARVDLTFGIELPEKFVCREGSDAPVRVTVNLRGDISGALETPDGAAVAESITCGGKIGFRHCLRSSARAALLWLARRDGKEVSWHVENADFQGMRGAFPGNLPRDRMEEHVKNLVKLYIAGHFMYMPYEIFTVDSKKKKLNADEAKILNPRDSFGGAGDRKITDARLYFGGDAVTFGEYDTLTGAKKLIADAFGAMLFGDAKPLEKFLTGKGSAFGKLAEKLGL